MITHKFGPVEFVSFYNPKFGDKKKKSAHVKQQVVTVVENPEDVLCLDSKGKSIGRVLETKYRWCFTKFPTSGTKAEIEALLAKLNEVGTARIKRIRGLQLTSVLSDNQLAYVAQADDERAETLETDWRNSLIAKDPETDEPYLYGDLEIEQYGRNVLVTNPDEFDDVDMRPLDEAEIMKRIADDTAAEALEAESDSAAPEYTEEAEIGASDVLSES